MASDGVRRVTLSLSPEVVSHLDELASRLHCSRSALTSELLRQALPSMLDLVACLPSELSAATEDDIRRLRGASAKLIGEQVERLILGGTDDLFR